MFKLEMLPLFGMKEGAIWGYLNVPEEKSDSKHDEKQSNTIEDDQIPF